MAQVAKHYWYRTDTPLLTDGFAATELMNVKREWQHMKQLIIATAGDCTKDKKKFCQDVIDARGDIGACLRQHEAELRDACKAKRAATVDKKERTATPSQGTTPENDKH
jgi:hypothetical protein